MAPGYPTDPTELMSLARAAAGKGYAPYSGFRVGAALLADGRVYSACNVENASYGLTCCAERSAVFQAVAAGARAIQALAVACPDAATGSSPEACMPCGACRQVISEFADPHIPVHIDGVGTFRLADLLPAPFTLKPMPGQRERGKLQDG